MPRNSPATAEALLHLLLDRHEDAKARSRAITQPIDYRRVGGPALQDDFHRVLREAARLGSIALEAERMGRVTGEFARVRLTDVEKLYAFLQRAPAQALAERAYSALMEAIPDLHGDPFFCALATDAHSSWRLNKSFLGLPVSKAQSLVPIFRLTHAIIHLSGPDIDHRTLSRRITKNSKLLEQNEGRIALLLRRHNPALSEEEHYAILEACGVVHRTRLLHVKGPLQLCDDTMRFEGTGSDFVGLPWSIVQKTGLHKPVDYVLTVENPTSFWRYCNEVDGNYLAMLTDGFPAREVLSCMRHLVSAATMIGKTPIFHWGDIDAGGVRIAAHLQKAFGCPIRLHQMDVSLASAHGTPIQSRKGLETLSTGTDEIGELARALCASSARMLEQEELDPVAPA